MPASPFITRLKSRPVLLIFGSPRNSMLRTYLICPEDLMKILREVIKKRIFYGQTDRKGSPPLYSQLFVNFFGVFFILDYDSMCSEMDFTLTFSLLSLSVKVSERK